MQEEVESPKEDSVRLEGAEDLSDILSEDLNYQKDEEEEELEAKPDYMDNNYWKPSQSYDIEELLADYL